MARDFYEVLGVSRTASPDEVQKAYRTLARRHHPDINSDPSAEDRFKEINEAYHVLSDPDLRSRYDAFGPDFQHIPAGAASGAGGRRSGGAGTRGYRSGGYSSRPRSYGDDAGINIEDLLGGMDGFEDLFSSRRGYGPMAGADQEAELPLTVEEAFAGGKRHITLAGSRGERGYEVSIPAGVVDGQRIRLTGQGGQGSGDGSAGDLYLVVRILPHPNFRLVGRDIHVEVPISPWEAALGASVPVPTPGGEAKVQVPAGTSSGRKLRLPGQGMPNPRGKAGDLYAEASIMVPRRLKRKEHELFEELSRVSTFDPRAEKR